MAKILTETQLMGDDGGTDVSISAPILKLEMDTDDQATGMAKKRYQWTSKIVLAGTKPVTVWGTRL